MFLNIKTKYLQDPDTEIEIENIFNQNKEEDNAMKIDIQQENIENKFSNNPFKQTISTKDSINSVSTKGSSNNSSLASLSNSYNNNIFNFEKFHNNITASNSDNRRWIFNHIIINQRIFHKKFS